MAREGEDVGLVEVEPDEDAPLDESPECRVAVYTAKPSAATTIAATIPTARPNDRPGLDGAGGSGCTLKESPSSCPRTQLRLT